MTKPRCQVFCAALSSLHPCEAAHTGRLADCASLEIVESPQKYAGAVAVAALQHHMSSWCSCRWSGHQLGWRQISDCPVLWNEDIGWLYLLLHRWLLLDSKRSSWAAENVGRTVVFCSALAVICAFIFPRLNGIAFSVFLVIRAPRASLSPQPRIIFIKRYVAAPEHFYTSSFNS